MIGLEIGLEKGEKRGHKKEKLNTAKRMIEFKIADELILKCCQINKKELNKLKIQMGLLA